MNGLIHPEALIGKIRWQQLQQDGAWLNARLEVQKLKGLSRLISKIPLLRQTVIPRTGPNLISSITSGLMSRDVTETDALLLMGAARMIKLKYKNGALTYKAGSHIGRDKLSLLCAAAKQKKRQLLENLTRETRGKTQDYLQRQLQDVNEFAPEQPLVPPAKTIQDFTVSTKTTKRTRYLYNPKPADLENPPALSENNIQEKFEQLFVQLQLKDSRLQPGHLAILRRDGVLTEKQLSGNSNAQLQALASKAAKHLQLKEKPDVLNRSVSISEEPLLSAISSLKTPMPYTSQTSLGDYPRSLQELYGQLQTMGLVNRPSQFQELVQQIKPQYLQDPFLVSQLLAFNQLQQTGGYDTADFAVMVNQQLLTPDIVDNILSSDPRASDTKTPRLLGDSLKFHSDHNQSLETRQNLVSWHIQRQGLRLEPSPKDGNCFYHAIAMQTGETQSQVRQRMHQQAELLINSGAQLSQEDGWKAPEDLQQDVQQGYIKNSAPGSARNPHWGSAELVPLICVTYQRPAMFYTPLQEDPVCYDSEGKPCPFTSIQGQNPVRLSHHINHWDAIIPNKRLWVPEPPATVHASQRKMEELMVSTQSAVAHQHESYSSTLPDTMLRGTRNPLAVTQGELRQLQNIYAAVQYLRTDAEVSRANSQDYCNAVEYFLRGKGYHQVRGTKMAFGSSATLTPVAGWNPVRLGQKGIEFASGNDFFQIFHPDHGSPSHQRYLLRKSAGNQGHHANLITLGTGRLAVIDAEANLVFPVYNPDGTPTQQAQDYFYQCQVQVIPADDIDDDNYIQQLDSASGFIRQGKFAEALLRDADELRQTIQAALIQKYQMVNRGYPTEQQLATFASQHPENAWLETLTRHSSALNRFLIQPDGDLELVKGLCTALNEQMGTIRRSIN